MIKRLLVYLPAALLAIVPAAADSVTVSVDAGILKANSGGFLADGDLVLLIASTSSGTFGAAPAGGFVSGDNIIVGSLTLGVTGAFPMADQNTANPGETYNTLTFNYGIGSVNNSTPTASSFAAGDKLALRWYDDFTLAQFLAGQTPTQGYYGTYTTPGTSAPDGGLGWVAPPAGDVLTGADGLNFFTSSDFGGSQPNSAGVANVAVQHVQQAPEPSTILLMSLGVGFLIFARRFVSKVKNCKLAQ